MKSIKVSEEAWERLRAEQWPRESVTKEIERLLDILELVKAMSKTLNEDQRPGSPSGASPARTSAAATASSSAA